MNNHINSLVKQYILWPELDNDGRKNIHFAHNSMLDFAHSVKEIIHDTTAIDHQISLFYLINEKLAYSRKYSQDVLGVKELEDYQFYQSTINNLSKQLMTYITISSIVEAQHVYLSADNLYRRWDIFCLGTEKEAEPFEYLTLFHQIAKIKKNPTSKFFFRSYFSEYKEFFHNNVDFDKFINFYLHIKSHDFTNYQKVVDTLLPNSLKDYNIQECLDYLKIIFTSRGFSEGYGGIAWANIADHALSYASGKINAEIFIDQAFSLEHNNGNIFNKDFLFNQTQNISIYFLYNNNSSHKVSQSIPNSLMLLTAQHMGVLQQLFSLDKLINFLETETSYDMYLQMQKENKFSDLSFNKFRIFIEAIIDSCVHIDDSLAPIKHDLLFQYPNLFTNQYEPLDFKRFFKEVTKLEADAYYALSQSVKNHEEFYDFWNYMQQQQLMQKKPILTQDFSFHLYDLANLPSEAFNKDIIGGKAWSLANMNQLGLPVPKAQVFSTHCSTSYRQHLEKFDEALEQSIEGFNSYLKNEQGNPVLCSIRSGAAVSMPGMMDTILNVGIDDTNYEYFYNTMGKHITDQCINKFMELFCSSRLNLKSHFSNEKSIEDNLFTFKEILQQYNIKYHSYDLFPLDQEAQIKESLYAVFESWDSPRAIAYRTEKGISHDLGTAAIVQQMVFGNLNENSCTGVVFSRDCLTGENKLVGEFLPKAQGEDVVSGSVTPFSIDKFKQFDLKSYKELELIAKQLEHTTGQIQDIEFTVEDGKLYILQHRQAICSHIANIKLLEDKSLDLNSLIKNIEPNDLLRVTFVQTEQEPIANGLSGNPGVLIGILIKDYNDMISYQDIYKEKQKNNPDFGWIFYTELTSPEHMPLMNKTHGFITEQGGFTSHAAIIARSLNKPCIVGLGGEKTERFLTGEILTIDATQGKIWKNEQNIVEQQTLAKTTAKILLDSYNVNMNSIIKKDFYNRIHDINSANKSWTFQMEGTYHLKKTYLKKDKFLNLGHKVAMILAAHQKAEIKNLNTIEQKINLSSNSKP